MTIRILQAWNGYPQQAVVSMSSIEENRLVGLGIASFDLDGPAENVRMAQLATDAAGNVAHITPAGDVLSITVPRGGDHEIMMAQDWLKARSPDGVINLATGQKYTISAPIEIDTQFIGVYGNASRFDISAIGAGLAAVTLGASAGNSAADPDDKYGRPSEFSGITLIGNPQLGRDSQQIAIRAHTSVAGASVRAVIERVRIRHAHRGVVVGSRAYALKLRSVAISSTKFCVQQEAAAVDFAEGVTLLDCLLFNSDCLLQDLGGQRWRMYGGHLDYFGDGTGGRITADDRLLDLRAGARAELYGVHCEWSYGDVAEQTNCPVKLTDATTKFQMLGGVFMKFDGQNPYYQWPIETTNAAQTVVMRDVVCVRQGRTTQITRDDCMVGGSNSSHTGVVGRVVLQNLMPAGVTTSDLPSVGAYAWGASMLRSGVDDPYVELVHRIALTGTAAIASANSPDGSVTARNATGKMLKITGQGKVIISFDNYEALRRHAWALFTNASAATGTITIKERHSTAVQKWDGTTLTTTADARAGYGAQTRTITGGGTNQWERTSWKDCNTDNYITPRMNNCVWAVEIDTTAMTGGALYVDDFALGLM